MKILCVVLVLLSVGAVSGAQEQPPSLQIGRTKVWLGMTRTELQSKLSGAQTLVGAADEGESLGMIVTGKVVEGQVWFRNGILIGADREWLTAGFDGVAALIGAIDSFTQEGLRACVISHRTDSYPDMQHEVAVIQCGGKALVIVKGRIGKTQNFEGGEDERITEQIGER